MGVLSRFEEEVKGMAGTTLELLPDTTNFMELNYE
jgi:hypothetical protein